MRWSLNISLFQEDLLGQGELVAHGRVGLGPQVLGFGLQVIHLSESDLHRPFVARLAGGTEGFDLGRNPSLDVLSCHPDFGKDGQDGGFLGVVEFRGLV